MSIIRCCSVIVLFMFHLTLCHQCQVREESLAKLLLDYDEINVMEGVKFKRDVATLHNNQSNESIDSAKAKGVTLKRIAQKFFSNHVMQFDLATMLREQAEVGTPRRRRHQQAFSMVLMGIVIFLMFFVTLGFQFLATFSGKAFLMAKMALLLASINGLKRVASSGVHYGLYHTPDPNFYPYDRFDRPRQLELAHA